MENKIIPTVGVLIIKDGKVLLVRHGEAAGHLNGRYGLPAGRIQDNESEKEAVKRELKEETGLDAASNDLILLPDKWFASIERKGGTKKFSLVVSLAEKFEGYLIGGAETAPEWIDIKEIGDYDLLPNAKEVIEKGLEFMRTRK